MHDVPPGFDHHNHLHLHDYLGLSLRTILYELSVSTLMPLDLSLRTILYELSTSVSMHYIVLSRIHHHVHDHLHSSACHVHNHRPWMLQPDLSHARLSNRTGRLRDHSLGRFLSSLRSIWSACGHSKSHRVRAANLDLAHSVWIADAAGPCLADLETVAKKEEGDMRGVREGRQGMYLWDVIG